jgi:hypothetical protein
LASVSNGLALGIAIFGFLLAWALPALAIGHIAKRRGRRFWPWFLVALLVSWVVAAIVLFATRDETHTDEVEELQRRIAVLESREAAREAAQASR